jgi:hypothetical protein
MGSGVKMSSAVCIELTSEGPTTINGVTSGVNVTDSQAARESSIVT